MTPVAFSRTTEQRIALVWQIVNHGPIEKHLFNVMESGVFRIRSITSADYKDNYTHQRKNNKSEWFTDECREYHVLAILNQIQLSWQKP